MSQPFPLRDVYEHFAAKLVGTKLGERPVEPCLFAVGIDQDGQIEDVDALPLGPFMKDNAGKDKLAMLLRLLVPTLKPHGCLVMVSEAWYVKKPYQKGQPIKDFDVSKDQDAKEGMLVKLLRPDGNLTGFLSVDASRTVCYEPPMDDIELQGRFNVEPTEVPPGTTVQ